MIRQSEREIFVDQSALDLRHTLVAGELDLNQFHILQTGELISSFSPLKIIGRIIGASHLVTFEISGKQYHEIFACQGYQTSGKKLVLSEPLGNLQTRVELTLWKNTKYSFSSQLYQNRSAAVTWFNKLEEKALKISKKNRRDAFGLTVQFPGNNLGRGTPKTVVVAESSVEQKQIHIVTAHSYPNELYIVKSQTVLDFCK